MKGSLHFYSLRPREVPASRVSGHWAGTSEEVTFALQAVCHPSRPELLIREGLQGSRLGGLAASWAALGSADKAAWCWAPWNEQQSPWAPGFPPLAPHVLRCHVHLACLWLRKPRLKEAGHLVKISSLQKLPCLHTELRAWSFQMLKPKY